MLVEHLCGLWPVCRVRLQARRSRSNLSTGLWCMVAWASWLTVPGQIPAQVIASLVFVCLLLRMRALCAKAIQSSPDWDMVCSRTWMQQFSSHLVHLSLVAWLPMVPSLGKAAAFVQTWGLSWPWVRREPRAQLRAQLRALKGFWVHLCRYKVHSRRTSAYRE